MAAFPWTTRPLAPFGLEIDADLSRPLDPSSQDLFRRLFHQHKLLVLHGQRLDEAMQVDLLGLLGRVLGRGGEYREIASDGNLGAAPLCYHSDLAFTPEPFKVLSLHALDVVDGASWTRFADGIGAARRLPEGLRDKIGGRDALTVISVTQTHRDVPYDPPAFLPQATRPILMPHPATGEPILYVSEMQTARLEGMEQEESDRVLDELFGRLYASENVYEHRWNTGDLVIWDNLALQHARPDLTGIVPRRLQRVCVADKSFFELCPQFAIGDPRIEAWSAGDKLRVA